VTLAGIDNNWITLRNVEQLREVMPHYSGGNDGTFISSATQVNLRNILPLIPAMLWCGGFIETRIALLDSFLPPFVFHSPQSL
jgi:hypothetical protein